MDKAEAGHWPFTTAELTAALRRYLDEPVLTIHSICAESLRARPSLGLIRGVGLEVERAGHREHYSYVLKEPQWMSRLGLISAGLREAGLYQSLAWQLPFAVPELVASDPEGKWLMLEPYPTEVQPESWSAQDYRKAIVNLARLHDNFWGLGEDLTVYPWIGRPLTAEHEIYVKAAAQSIEAIVQHGAPAFVAESIVRTTMLAQLVSQADVVVHVLQSAPQTLLHGDYWPGNISIDEDGRHIIYDWQMVSVGPGVLDLVGMVNNSRLRLSPLPIDPAEMIALYRREIADRTGQMWTEVEWACLWDFALMWQFIQEWFVILAAPSVTLSAGHAYLIEQIWLEPTDRAVGRWLKQLQ
jgi:hypothetical protein